MKTYIGKIIKSAAGIAMCLMAVLAATSCSGQDEPEPTGPTPQIVFLFSPGGLGDMSYNDCILRGVQQFKKDNPLVDLYIYSPTTIEEAERIFSDWLKRPGSDIPVLFTLASSDYEPMVDDYIDLYALTPNKSLLLFESKKEYGQDRVCTFQISMFGASYLAGVMAAACNPSGESLVVLANPTDAPIALAREGFTAGLGHDCPVEYMADDWTGYISASLAYKKMAEWAPRYGFIFPVAGGSNAGIYRYTREFPDSPFLAGMDTDQSGLSTKITGSVLKHIDRMVYEYLTEWLLKGEMPKARLYGLDSGYADFLLSPRFEAYRPEIEKSRTQAIESEKDYNEKHRH